MTELELEFAILAIGAEPGVSGKLHIFGGAFEAFDVPFVPAVAPPFAFVTRLCARGITEVESHKLKLTVINPEGAESTVGEYESVDVHPSQWGRDESYASAIFLIAMKFLSEGKYRYALYVDGKKVKTVPLWINVVPQESEKE